MAELSYIFTVRDSDENVWEPALAVGQLFMGAVDALSSRILKLPSGLDDVSGDWVLIDVAQYGAFVEAALKRRVAISHTEFMSLLDGVLPVMIMLADKCGAGVVADTPAQRGYLEWARDEDRVLHGHLVEQRDGSVYFWGLD
ncbi:DUF6086 family protein [Streptomyces sp. NPDC048664]|uniref:DUF6086 family protein n=1 Tax=Streptomyces sp. NPDC048664 TaxID=3154505 RepID=UPI003416D026